MRFPKISLATVDLARLRARRRGCVNVINVSVSNVLYNRPCVVGCSVKDSLSAVLSTSTL